MNIPSSVTTDTWVIVHYFATALGFFGLLGLAGLYARQAEKAGWLGLAGFIVFSAWMTLVCGFSFVEAFILPRLATESPAFVKGLLGMFSGVPSEINLGVLPTLWNISGPMYIVGPLLFGIATFRARVLPRWAGALLVLGAVLIPVGALVPPEWQPKIMLPVGLAFAWLGYALFSERRASFSETLPDRESPPPLNQNPVELLETVCNGTIGHTTACPIADSIVTRFITTKSGYLRNVLLNTLTALYRCV